jgi:7-cyano-7-deazaguanine synthase
MECMVHSSESRVPSPSAFDACAVLVSGGLDSAILLAESLPLYARVCPLYVRTGLSWEEVELKYLRRFLQEIQSANLQPLVILHFPVTDLYRDHWSLTGQDVPDAASPDDAVFLPGRNVILLAKALLWCHLNGVPRVALGHLGSNPFPDATPNFFDGYQRIVNQALGGQVLIERPYAHLSKIEVLHRGRVLPLHWTFSCIQPQQGRHCGRCNKCAERRRAFLDAGLPDDTVYDSE